MCVRYLSGALAEYGWAWLRSRGGRAFSGRILSEDRRAVQPVPFGRPGRDSCGWRAFLQTQTVRDDITNVKSHYLKQKQQQLQWCLPMQMSPRYDSGASFNRIVLTKYHLKLKQTNTAGQFMCWNGLLNCWLNHKPHVWTV